jgi:hypothetical protein
MFFIIIIIIFFFFFIFSYLDADAEAQDGPIGGCDPCNFWGVGSGIGETRDSMIEISWYVIGFILSDKIISM